LGRKALHAQEPIDDRSLTGGVQSAHTFVGQVSRIVKDKPVRNPIVHVQHAGNGGHKDIDAGTHDGNIDTCIEQLADEFPCTWHQLHTGIRPEDVILVNRVLDRFPHLDVRPHELHVTDLASNEASQIVAVLRSKSIVNGSP